MELNFDLHPKQLEVFQSKARFKVCAAGRRAGKSYLSAICLLLAGLEEERDGISLKNKEVWYIAPTFQQAKDILWNLLKNIGRDLIDSTLENTATIRLLNGRTIKLKGSDRPDTLRGVGISYVVLDEYAFMKPEVWDLIIRPTLSDVRGNALFIGTPEGKNHFYDLWMMSHSEPEWEAFQFNSTDNPMIDPKEVEKARNTMSSDAFRQEFEASFEAAGGGAFKENEIKVIDSPPPDLDIYISCDPAGYGTGDGMVKSNLKRLDEFAIAVVGVNTSGWYVLDVISGRWGIREASLHIVKAARDHSPIAIGIESGSLKNAIMPYLEDQMRRLNVFPHIEGLTHGGKKKTERILWALQGRMQHGRFHLVKGNWNKKVIDQLMDFPNPLAHDDLIDAIAYTDQLATIAYNPNILVDDYDPMDSVAGY